MSLTFDDYMKQTRATAIYPEAGEGTVLALAYVGLGLGETGEVQGKIKKIIRDAGGVIDENVAKGIKKELGDTLWYIARAIDELGGSFDQVAFDNLEKLSDRADRGVIKGSGDDR